LHLYIPAKASRRVHPGGQEGDNYTAMPAAREDHSHAITPRREQSITQPHQILHLQNSLPTPLSASNAFTTTSTNKHIRLA
jgi:hypothetical protein